jgi:hypothetical protein
MLILVVSAGSLSGVTSTQTFVAGFDWVICDTGSPAIFFRRLDRSRSVNKLTPFAAHHSSCDCPLARCSASNARHSSFVRLIAAIM